MKQWYSKSSGKWIDIDSMDQGHTHNALNICDKMTRQLRKNALQGDISMEEYTRVLHTIFEVSKHLFARKHSLVEEKRGVVKMVFTGGHPEVEQYLNAFINFQKPETNG